VIEIGYWDDTTFINSIAPDGVIESGNVEAVSGGKIFILLLKDWVLNESFEISNIVFENNMISTADITWLDGDIGTISNIITDNNNNITSIRYNRSGIGSYANVNYSYDSNGNIISNSVALTGI